MKTEEIKAEDYQKLFEIFWEVFQVTVLQGEISDFITALEREGYKIMRVK